MHLAGSTCVGVGTAIATRKENAPFAAIEAEMEAFMKKEGIKKISDLKLQE